MNATVIPIPGVAPREATTSLNLSAAELVEASGGYVQPSAQLKALHDRGFTRAWRGANGKVILERAHYESVVRGQFGAQGAANDNSRAPLPPNRSGFLSKFGPKAGA